MQIGVALSGGGFRATVFHLGVLGRLAAQGLLEEITFISSVSGGSLGTGLVFAMNSFQWPSSRLYLEKVLPVARQRLTETDLQSSLIVRTLGTLGLLRSRATDLAFLLRRLWGIEASLRNLPVTPRWIINTTCYETGKDWRFERKRMGDYIFGYELEPDFPISEAVAASAGYPGLIGPLALKTVGRKWFRYPDSIDSSIPDEIVTPAFPQVHLWDGGVYDNLGLEPLFKPGGGYRPGVDFLIVSDASSPLDTQNYGGLWMVPQAYRLVGIAMNQIRSLRARMVVKQFDQTTRQGCYMRLGDTVQEVLERAGPIRLPQQNNDSFTSIEDARGLARMATHIQRMSSFDFNRLYQYGFEVANATLHSSIPQRFPFYDNPMVVAADG